MVRSKFFYFLLCVFLLFNNCSEDPASPDNSDGDPNGEEALLLAFGDDESEGKVKVMSRNIYIGTNVALLFLASGLDQIPAAVLNAFELLENTDFTERAEALADEIEKTKPHLVGLQEVAHVFLQSPGDFLTGNAQAASMEIYDYLQILLDALADRGLDYQAAAVLVNADIELPILPSSYSTANSQLDDIRLSDRDVILVRGDITYSDVALVRYADSLIVDSTLGISVPRGYTALTAQIGGSSYRFANTHLESFDVTQALRNGQLGQLLSDMENQALPVILAGDFNFGPPNSLYQQLTAGGYQDAWVHNTLTYNSDGFTYGHEDDLKNGMVSFSSRIDYVFVKSAQPFAFEESFVVGDELRDRTETGLWPSDHGGVLSKINFNQ